MSTMLIVDDDPEIREAEKRLLVGEGHSIVTAGNGRDALELLNSIKPDLILLDLLMPVMDGFTFLAERQRRLVALDVPVICLSNAGDAALARARGLGASECLSKLGSADDLCACVKRHARAATVEGPAGRTLDL